MINKVNFGMLGLRQARVSRRTLLNGALGASAAALLAACGGNDDDDGDSGSDGDEPTATAMSEASPTVTEPQEATEAAPTEADETDEPAPTDEPDPTAGDEGWTYTDGRGRELTMDAAPRKVVALNICAAALWDFNVQPAAIWGPQTTPEGEPDPQIGNIDLDQVESLGEELSELDLEKLVQLSPDVLIMPTFDNESLWPIQEESTPQLNEVTTTLAVSVSARHSSEIISTYEYLAEEFGAAINSDELVEARDRYEQALTALQNSIEGKPEIKVACISAGPDSLWIGNPNNQQDLLQAGANLFEGGEYSWEQMGEIDADLILLDQRSQWLQPEALAEKPTWASHPAVVAGQVAPWTLSIVYSYLSYTPVLEGYANALAEAELLG